MAHDNTRRMWFWLPYMYCIVFDISMYVHTYMVGFFWWGNRKWNREIRKFPFIKKNEEVEKSMNLVPHIVHTAARYTRKYNCQLITPKFDWCLLWGLEQCAIYRSWNRYVHVTTLVTKRQTKTCGLYDDDSGPKSCDSTVNSQSLLN